MSNNKLRSMSILAIAIAGLTAAPLTMQTTYDAAVSNAASRVVNATSRVVNATSQVVNAAPRTSLAAADMGYTLAAGPVRAGVIKTGTEGLSTGAATIPVFGAEMPAYYARPTGAA